MRRAAKRDASEPAIFEALRKLGQYVWPLNWTMDALCMDVSTKRFWVADCKTGNAGLTSNQELFITVTAGAPVFILRTPEDAARAVNEVRNGHGS